MKIAIRLILSEELGYKFMDTDDCFRLPTNPRYTTKRSKEERLALMKKEISRAHMRSKEKHDEWQKLLQCKQIVLNGADDLEKNFEKVQSEINSVIGRTVTVTVDRPLGSYRPEHKDGKILYMMVIII